MFNSKKSQYGRWISTFLCMFLFVIFTSPANAEEHYANLPPDANMMGMSSLESIDLPFDPNDYTFLIYNPGGRQASIVQAMEVLGIPFDERGPVSEVTMEDLETHDILIVGWNYSGDTSGLDANTLAAGITGRVILSGHDLDYHTASDIPPVSVAQTMLIQAIDWVLKGDGTGMITLGCTSSFPYLPGVWGVEANDVTGEDVDEFTAYGLASGVYDGLEPNDMDNWGYSYHNIFTIKQVSLFVPFELGGSAGSDIITTACDNIKLPYFYIYKDDNDVNCVYPFDEFTGNLLYYSISWDANGYADSNVVVTDFLPIEVDEPNYISDGGVYDSNAHKVTWTVGSVTGNDSGNFQIRCGVNEYARPHGVITNRTDIEGDKYFFWRIIDTNVCYWCGEIIYVDVNAPTHYNSGGSWQSAYKDLQDALETSENCDCNEIWVAAGTYEPSVPSGSGKATFNLVDGVCLYGGFSGNETSVTQRNLVSNETILDGKNSMEVVVTGSDVSASAVIDGFTIMKASYYGIKCESGSPVVTRCKIKDNYYGIYSSETSNLSITKCIFCGNDKHGIWIISGNPTIKNNWIYKNSIQGICLDDAGDQTVVRNNTIVYNTGHGVAGSTSDHIINCIVWGNNNQNQQLNCNATYSCIEGDTVYSGEGNINTDPCFVQPDTNNYHLDPNAPSPCIDAGDPDFSDYNETDIDGETRLFDGDGNGIDRVDMGADEFYWSPADFDANKFVNFVDYAMFAEPWGTSSGDADYNDSYDLIDNDSIDNNDLRRFCEDWLWEPAWTKSAEEMEMMLMMGGGAELTGDGMVREDDLREFTENWL